MEKENTTLNLGEILIEKAKKSSRWVRFRNDEEWMRKGIKMFKNKTLGYFTCPGFRDETYRSKDKLSDTIKEFLPEMNTEQIKRIVDSLEGRELCYGYSRGGYSEKISHFIAFERATDNKGREGYKIILK